MAASGTRGSPPRPGGWPGRVYRLLAGLPLSFVLMVALGLLLAVRALIAQKQLDLREANAIIRWLTEVAPDDAGALRWPTVAVIALFVVNLALSSVEMTRKALATARSLVAPRTSERLAESLVQEEFAAPSDGAERLERLLRARGWRVRRVEAGGETALSAARRQAGHWTTLLFHLSFFVILVGALLSVLTRFQGYFELAPGEAFAEVKGAYLRASAEPPLFEGYRGFRLALDEMELAFWPEGGMRDRASRIRLADAAGVRQEEHRLAVNHPIGWEGLSIYQAGREGFIAGLSVTDSVGTRAEGTVHFQFPERSGDAMRGRAVLPGTRLALILELRTGMVSQLTGEIARTARDSVSYLRVFKREGPHERLLGTVVGGAELELEGLRLSFDSLKPFMSFAVVRDEGTPVIFAGLALALLALVALYFWVPENLWAVVVRGEAGARVLLAGASDRYLGSFASRFRELADELRSDLSGATSSRGTPP